MQRFTDLKLWQRRHALVLEVYTVTAGFPISERYGITGQPHRRAALSVSTNVAEGSKRQANAEYCRFINIAESSLAETESLLIVSRDLEYLPVGVADRLLSEVSAVARMLHTLRVRVAASTHGTRHQP